MIRIPNPNDMLPQPDDGTIDLTKLRALADMQSMDRDTANNFIKELRNPQNLPGPMGDITALANLLVQKMPIIERSPSQVPVVGSVLSKTPLAPIIPLMDKLHSFALGQIEKNRGDAEQKTTTKPKAKAEMVPDELKYADEVGKVVSPIVSTLLQELRKAMPNSEVEIDKTGKIFARGKKSKQAGTDLTPESAMDRLMDVTGRIESHTNWPEGQKVRNRAELAPKFRAAGVDEQLLRMWVHEGSKAFKTDAELSARTGNTSLSVEDRLRLAKEGDKYDLLKQLAAKDKLPMKGIFSKTPDTKKIQQLLSVFDQIMPNMGGMTPNPTGIARSMGVSSELLDAVANKFAGR